MRRLLLAGFFLMTLIRFCFGQNSKTNFDNDWKFQLGHAANPEKDFNYSIANIFSKSGGAARTAIDPQFDDSKWRKLDLPHDWAVELPFVHKDNFDVMAHGYKPVGGLFPESSIGWYRKHFTIPRSDSGQRYQLQFDGIFRDAGIWVNGFYLGNNKSGYVGVNYDITDFIRFDRDNVIVVRADATQYEGWFYEGAGIYRHVWLLMSDNLHIDNDGVFVYSASDSKRSFVFAEITVRNNSTMNRNASVISYITDRTGRKIAEASPTPVSVPVNGRSEIKRMIEIPNARLWNLDDPYLYRLVTKVIENGKITDSNRIRFGIRNIDIRPTGVFLNGKHVKLLGVNCHQDHGGLGSALPDYLQYYRIRLLKNMGVNAYRTSHNAPTPELLDACDSLGMLVLDEQRLLNSGPEYMDQFERLIRRDRSHASVFMWSIGNEEGWIHTTSIGKRIAESFITKQKLLDPTRTCTYAADVGNVFNGVNEVIPVRSFNYRQFAVADYHRDHPAQPIIGTEMGSTVTTRGIYVKDTVRGYVPDQDITAPWWASRAEDWWTLAATNDFWLGGFVWTGFDYRGEPTPYQWPNINSHFGIMEMCGFPKNIYYYYQSWWTDKDVLHISPHWNFREKAPGWNKPVGDSIEVWVNSNADQVELFLNGKSQGKKAMPRNSHLTWTLNYTPGMLEAVAMKDGRTWKQRIETTGLPNEIVVTPYKTTILADGKDATVINISVLDREGREVPDADNLIEFSLRGDGKIIGVANGDPSSHEADKCGEGFCQRRLFNGKCQVIIQGGPEPSMIHFTAKAKGLWEGSTDIQTIPVTNISRIKIDPDYPTANYKQLKEVDKMLGADISFLPELEAKGMKFSDKGVEKDAIQILKDHGFNYVRLRLFNDPSRDSGYSPKSGFCDLGHTKQMAKRAKDAGMKLLLDFHYSDYWADPGKQYNPAAWRELSFDQLKKSVYDFTRDVVQQLKAQGTTPDMVQIGNEINHGIIWPEGNVSNMDGLAALINAGTAAVKSVDPSVTMMLHVALGGQNDESVFFIDNMIARGVYFDVIGESYYPKWHGTTDDLRDNLDDLVRRYNKDVIVVEYSQKKEDVNRIGFGVRGGKGKGTCIWEPLNTWEKIFDNDGKSNQLIQLYDEFKAKYLGK
jgi:beta-galactosidase